MKQSAGKRACVHADMLKVRDLNQDVLQTGWRESEGLEVKDEEQDAI